MGRSPATSVPSFDELAKDFFHLWVLLASVIEHLFDHLVPLAFLLQDGAGLVVLHLRLEAVRSNLVVAIAHGLELLVLEVDGRPLDVFVQEIQVLLAHVLIVRLVLLLLIADVAANIVDLALPLIDGSVELHGLLSRVLQVLLKVGDLAGKLSLRGAILRILLFDLGEVFELDSLSLEDVPLHVLNQLLLLLAEELVLQLHPVDLFLHRDDLGLSNRWVESVLHLFLELVLPLPEKDLLLSLDHIDDDVRLLLLELGDLVLNLDGLVLHLLELLLELHFNVEIVIRQLLLLLVVLENQVVQLVHLEDLVLLGYFELTDSFVVTFHLTVDPNFLLIKDGLLRAETVVVTVNPVLVFLLLDELDLVRDPVLLHVGRLIVHLLDLLLDVVAMVLDWADILVSISTALQVSALSIQSVHLQGLLLDSQQASLDILLDLLHVTLLLLKLGDQVFELFLEDVILCGRVEVVEADTGDFIGVIFNVDFFLRDVLVGDFSLLEEIGGGLLDSLLLTGVGDNVVSNRLCLRMQLHNAFVQDVVL